MKRYKIRPYSFIWAMSYIGPALALAAVIWAGAWCMGVAGL
jgi:hypothetical protein